MRTAWRRAALRMHPDKRGGAAEFRARDSGEYVEYEVVQVEGTARAGVPARHQMRIRARRIGEPS